MIILVYPESGYMFRVSYKDGFGIVLLAAPILRSFSGQACACSGNATQ